MQKIKVGNHNLKRTLLACAVVFSILATIFVVPVAAGADDVILDFDSLPTGTFREVNEDGFGIKTVGFGDLQKIVDVAGNHVLKDSVYNANGAQVYIYALDGSTFYFNSLNYNNFKNNSGSYRTDIWAFPYPFSWGTAKMVELRPTSSTFSTLTSAALGVEGIELCQMRVNIVSSSADYSVDNINLTIVNRPPVADAGPDQTVEQTSLAGADVTLNGSGSFDPNSDPLTYHWTWPGGSATGVNPTISLPPGGNIVTLVVNDGALNSRPDTIGVTVQDTTAPIVTPLADVTVEATGVETPVNIGTATATDVVGVVSITSNAPDTFEIGTTIVTWTAIDAAGNEGTATQNVTVQDTTAPEISLSVSPNMIWPPNNKMVEITAMVTTSDVCDPNPTVVLTSITSNEPDDTKGKGNGNATNDIQGADIGTADYNFLLRAERNGNGNSRIYTITYTATDASGNSTSASATVTVPHDQGKAGK